MCTETRYKKTKVGKDLSTGEMCFCVLWLISASVLKALEIFNLEIKEIIAIAFAALAMFAPITFSIWLDKILDFKKGGRRDVVDKD